MESANGIYPADDAYSNRQNSSHFPARWPLRGENQHPPARICAVRLLCVGIFVCLYASPCFPPYPCPLYSVMPLCSKYQKAKVKRPINAQTILMMRKGNVCEGPPARVAPSSCASCCVDERGVVANQSFPARAATSKGHCSVSRAPWFALPVEVMKLVAEKQNLVGVLCGVPCVLPE